MQPGENEILFPSGLPRDLPYNLEAEQSVLGAILLDSGSADKVLGYLKPESFYRPQHQQIFSIVMRMYVASETIDMVTVLEQVCREDVFESEKAAKSYLAELAAVVPATESVETYARIVQEKYCLRSLIATFEEVIAASREGNTDPNLLMDLAEQGIYNIRQGRDNSGFTHIRDIIISTYDRLQRLSGEDRMEYLGLPTGYPLLDNQITGLNRSDLLVLAARPGMGKTAFALNMALNVAKQKKKVAVFSLEMSKEQLVERLIASEGLVSAEHLRRGAISAEDWEKISVASQNLSPLPIYIDDTAGIRIGEMKSKLRRLRDVSLVVIDYLQLMTAGENGKRRSENRVQEVSELTRALKIMAKDFAVPVLVLSQLSRGPESRTDRRPLLSDLRESGSIEQDADIVMFLYRDAYYNKESPTPGAAECIVAKNRHGETGSVPFGWDGEHTKFTNPEFGRDD